MSVSDAPYPLDVIAAALDGEEAAVTYGYYGASHRIDREHAVDLALRVADALAEAGYRIALHPPDHSQPCCIGPAGKAGDERG